MDLSDYEYKRLSLEDDVVQTVRRILKKIDSFIFFRTHERSSSRAESSSSRYHSARFKRHYDSVRQRVIMLFHAYIIPNNNAAANAANQRVTGNATDVVSHARILFAHKKHDGFLCLQ
jgi:hypothetical protein